MRALILSLATNGRLTIEEARPPGGSFVEWPKVRLADLAPEFQNGASSRGDVGGVPTTVIRLADITAGEVDTSAPRQIPIRAADRSKYLLRPGDILVIRVNGSADLVGRFILCRSMTESIYCDHFIRMRLDSRVVLPEYLRLVGDSGSVRTRIASLFVSTAGQKTVNQGHLGSIAFALPPIDQQARIVARVEELMQLCDALEQNGRLADEQHVRLRSTLFDALAASESPHALAENWQRVAEHFDLLLDRHEAVDALEQTILQLAVRGLLVRQDARDEPASQLIDRIDSYKERLASDGKRRADKPLVEVEDGPFDLPENWEWVRLGRVAEAIDYGTSQKSVDDPTAVPILRMGNIQAGKVVMTGLKYLIDGQGDLPSLLLRREDLLFNRTNSYELVGKTGLYEGFDRDVTFASYLIRVRLAERFCSARYVNLFMNTIDCRRHEIEPDLTQQTGQANYNGTKLRNIRLPLPPLAEQHRIVARIEELRRLCAQLRERLTDARRTQSRLADALVAEAAA